MDITSCALSTLLLNCDDNVSYTLLDVKDYLTRLVLAAELEDRDCVCA